jgi:FAD/FMN-containing dehydrogenase
VGLRPPDALQAPAALIVEVGGHDDPVEELATAVAELDLVTEPVVAVTADQRRRLWEVRESFAEAINRLGPPVKLDVSVPLSRMAAFVAALPDAVPAGLGVIVFGHLGDGNLHVNVTGVEPGDDTLATTVERSVLEAVVAEGGSISAEHGIGTAKAAYLQLCRSPEEIAAFRAVKSALDPHGILNPHVLLTAQPSG